MKIRLLLNAIDVSFWFQTSWDVRVRAKSSIVSWSVTKFYEGISQNDEYGVWLTIIMDSDLRLTFCGEKGLRNKMRTFKMSWKTAWNRGKMVQVGLKIKQTREFEQQEKVEIFLFCRYFGYQLGLWESSHELSFITMFSSPPPP